MVKSKKIKSLWYRLRDRHRISILDEDTLVERGHIHLTGWGAIVVMALLFLLSLALFSLVILYTPIRNYLPGYSENIRQQLLVESARVDSIGTSLELQRQYLNIIKQVVAGEVKSDTVQSLDSMQIIMREQLLEAKSEAAAEFMALYEAKEKDYLQLFDVSNTSPVISFFRPVMGGIIQPFSEREKCYGVAVKSLERENVIAVLAGAVVYVNYELGNTYTIIIQHTNYLSVYRNTTRVLKSVGDQVQEGESIAIMGTEPLWFELWKDGKPIDPEGVIAF
jgi:murein DD-endopeptidase MepM/ murein hydrolase activator NlpD